MFFGANDSEETIKAQHRCVAFFSSLLLGSSAETPKRASHIPNFHTCLNMSSTVQYLHRTWRRRNNGPAICSHWKHCKRELFPSRRVAERFSNLHQVKARHKFIYKTRIVTCLGRRFKATKEWGKTYAQVYWTPFCDNDFGYGCRF